MVPELISSPYLWLVNICRTSCGFCQGLTPSWQALAHELRQEVQVAYWDAELLGRPPSVFGEVNATPTIRAFVPRASGSMQQVDYLGDRSNPDLVQFAHMLMPDFVEVISDQVAWKELEDRSHIQRRLRLVLFLRRTASASPPPILKAISAKFFERVNVAEVRVHPSVPDTATFARQLVPHSLFPAACLLPANGREMRCLTEAPSFARLSSAVEEELARAAALDSDHAHTDRRDLAGGDAGGRRKEEL